MSERDLPSRVDSERTIPSSKSVPALHHISPNSEQSRGGGPHDMFNPGYSRTSSNNSINTNSTPAVPQNGTTNAQTGLRSRSTHNLHQQDGFYQNLSVYRNKMPSPQQLGDRFAFPHFIKLNLTSFCLQNFGTSEFPEFSSIVDS